jgi:hypothetical protein
MLLWGCYIGPGLGTIRSVLVLHITASKSLEDHTHGIDNRAAAIGQVRCRTTHNRHHNMEPSDFFFFSVSSRNVLSHQPEAEELARAAWSCFLIER